MWIIVFGDWVGFYDYDVRFSRVVSLLFNTMLCKEVRFRVGIVNKRTYKEIRIYVIQHIFYVSEDDKRKIIISERV